MTSLPPANNLKTSNDMLELELSQDETTQLYVLMSLFAQTGELGTLATKIADFLGPYYGITTINKKVQCHHD